MKKQQSISPLRITDNGNERDIREIHEMLKK